MTRYFHVSSDKQLKVGDQLSSNNSTNNNFYKGIIREIQYYSSDILNRTTNLERSQELMKGYENMNKISERLEGMNQRDVKNLISDLVYLNTRLLFTSMEYIKYVREEIFENERLMNFPNRPSRKTGIWITDIKSLDYWYNDKVKNKSYTRIFEVLPTKDTLVFQCDPNLISVDNLSIGKLKSDAQKYWSNTELNSTTEYLIEGELEIIKIFDSLPL